MKKTLIIIACIGIIYIVLTVLLSRGDTYLIESDEPLQDIVVMCDWSSALGTLHGGTHNVTHKKAMVVESGKPYNCGINWSAWLSLSFKSAKMVKHPTHTFAYIATRDGVIVSRSISKLDILDEQKAKFEAGEWENKPVPGWDKDKSSEYRYAHSFGGCGFGHQYLDYYSEEKQVDKNYFYNKYNDFLLDCNQKIYEEVYKYDPIIAERLHNPDKTMKRIWSSDKWRKYE